MNREIKAIEEIAQDSLMKESIRNEVSKESHPFSEYCSCGICHNASLIAEAVHSKLSEMGYVKIDEEWEEPSF